MLQLTPDTVEVRIGEGVYSLKQSFGAMVRFTKLQDAIEGGDMENTKTRLAVMQEIKEAVMSSSDIPGEVIDGLTMKQVRQLMNALVVGEDAGDAGKN